MARISTSAIERTNLSVRMEQSRLARKTLRHSKDLRQHRAAVALYYTYFNLCRMHETLRTTPAVALGVTLRQWTIGELIDAALDIKKPFPRFVDAMRSAASEPILSR